MPATYPDGTLLRGPGPEVYVIVNGMRHRIPDFGTGMEGGRPDQAFAVPQVADGELYTIPEGAALEAVIQQSQGPDEVVSDMPRRYLESTATLSQEAARLDVWTRTWTRQPWLGFTGGVVVLFGAQNGEYIWNTDLQQFGVDGFRIPFKRWNREDWWFVDVPADVAGRTAALQIVHTHSLRDRFFAALEDIRRATQILVDIANNLRTIVGGSEASAEFRRVGNRYDHFEIYR